MGSRQLELVAQFMRAQTIGIEKPAQLRNSTIGQFPLGTRVHPNCCVHHQGATGETSSCVILGLGPLGWSPALNDPPHHKRLGNGSLASSVAGLAAAGLWFLLRKRPTAEELERARRRFLVQSGRLVDGMLLDICEVEATDGRTLTMLIFSYRIAGVDYECSQDITNMRDVVDSSQVRAGFPCSIRYQPGNPQNSIVVAEEWTGIAWGFHSCLSSTTPNPLI